MERCARTVYRVDVIICESLTKRFGPAAVELAGYRVVQESLTNAIRYAAGAVATVRLAYRDDGIMVEVIDDGPGTRPMTALAQRPVRPRCRAAASDWPGSGSDAAIARSLVIGETTAKTHVTRIMTKLRLRDRARRNLRL